MFVLMQILRCGSGRQREGLKRLHWIHGLMAAKEDSGGCVVAKHLGNPFDYLVLRFWQSPEAMARRTNWYYQDPWPIFPSNEPQGIYQTQDIHHHWEEVARTEGDSDGGLIWRLTSVVQDKDWPDFLKLRKAEAAVMKVTGGLVSARTYRCTEDAQHALTLVRLRDRAALEAIEIEPEKVRLGTAALELSQSLEYPELTVFANECFEVVDEYRAPAG
jgi:hypothetical protein